MRKVPYIRKLLADKDFATKVLIFFSTRTTEEGYDGYEENYTYTNLNPLAIYGYVTDISPEALVWKQYGLQEIGAKEILCEAKYKTWFTQASKITIAGDIYEVYREAAGNRVIIQNRPFQTIRVLLQKKDGS